MTDTGMEAMEVDGDDNGGTSVAFDSNAASTQKYYSLLQSIVQQANAMSVEDAVESVKSSFEKANGVIEQQNFCLAVGLFSMLHKSFFTQDAESSILPLLQTLVTDDKIGTQLARCLLGHIPDSSVLDAIFKKEQIGDLQRKLRQTNTSTFYRQHKFNLLAEESEGYSKLLLMYSHPTATDESMLEHIMGTFSLDPVRCLDLAIDCLSLYLKKSKSPTDNADTQLSSLIHSITDTVATLAKSTQKLPQLLAFKLEQQPDVLVFLPTLKYLCCKQILILQELVPYMHHDADSSYEWETVVATTATTLVAHEQKRTASMGRARLTTTTKTAETDTTRNDLIASVSNVWIVRIMLALLQTEEDDDDATVVWDNIVSPLSKDWSDMAILFPDSIGTAVLDALSRRLQPLLVMIQSPWVTTTATPPSGEPNLPGLLDHMAEPLDSILDSGCMRLRPGLYISICRLLVQAWPNDSEMIADAAIKKDLMSFLGTFLLPTLSVFPPNPALNQELWLVLQKLAYPDRYCLYNMWAASSASLLWLAQAEATVMKDARYALRRLSKDTVRELSRNIGKCCSRCPIAVFSTILNQIESYDNLVHVMIDACAFVGPLGWDVLSYCILQRLSAARRNRYKESGVHASQWLQSLESFTGAFYKRYPTTECQGLVSYLRSRLEDGNVLELGMLGALVKSAGGWAFRDHATAAAAGLTASQLIGRAGSITLQRQTMSFGVVEGIDWRAAKEIQRVLRADGVALLVLLTQVEYQIVFESKKPVKLIGNSVDECRAIRTILLDFLTNEQVEETAMEHFMKSLPAMNKLLDDFHMEATSAWSLHRPILRKDPASVTQEARESLRSAIPSNSWTQITFQLYEAFFSNALFDIHYPEDKYNKEISLLEKKVENLSQKTRGPDEQLTYMKRIVDKLKSDRAAQSEHVHGIHEQIKSKAKDYFVNAESSVNAMMVFTARCIYPRCMQGPDDAFYCVKFIELLHQTKTPGFGLLHLYDCLIPILSRSLYCLTEGEAACASILFEELWKTVNACRYEKDMFSSYFPSESVDDYKILFNKWHSSLGATCLGCLKSAEYIHLRNGLIVMARIVDVFPTKPKLGNKLLAALGPLQEEGNSMADIRAAARAYNMQLTNARGKGAWKEEDRAAVKDRENKIKAAAAERQKRAEETMEEIKRDSEKITEEIGERDSRDRGRGHHHDRRTPEPTDRRPPPAWQPRTVGGASQHHPPPPEPPRQRVGGEDTMRRRDDRESRTPRTETRKRSHPSSPIEQGEAVDDGAKTQYKRSRGPATDASNKEQQQEEGEADTGGRRRQRRRNTRR